MPRLAILLAVVVLASCRPEAPRPDTPLTIHFTCDVSGRLEPCGCFTGQHGGLTRLRTWLRERDREGPSLRFDIGNALAGTADYERIQYESLLAAFEAMGFEALNLGAREAGLSREQLAGFAAQHAAPLVSASVVDARSREPLLPPYRILDHDGRRIAVLGLLDPRSCPDPGEGLAVLDLEQAVDRVLPQLTAEAELVVVLAFAPESALRELARSYFEFDLILGGDVAGPAQELHAVNESRLAWTTGEGRTVGTVRARIGGGEPPRLIEPEYAVELLYEQIPQDPGLRQLVTDYRERIRHTELAVDSPGSDDHDRIPGVEAAARYVGSESCQACHAGDHAGWADSGHAHAFDTLVAVGAEADPRCIGCHTVGFGEPTGYHRSTGPGPLAGVGCESCHGPGSVHVAERSSGREPRFRFRPLGAADCRKCHYGEFSRPFDWDRFWPEIRHGSGR